MEFKKEFKNIYTAYKDKLGSLSKASLDTPADGLEWFITYLNYLRDKSILVSTENKNITDKSVVSLAIATEEYDLYNSCIFNYYDQLGRKLTDEPDDVVLDKYNKEKQKHWRAFWVSVTMNLQEWLTREEINNEFSF